MKCIALLIPFLILIESCSTKEYSINSTTINKADSNLLSVQNLPSQFFTVDINTDNSLITKGGMIVQIPKGSLSSDKNPVEIEIKEALSLKDIFLAGLQTKSNGEILSSGGMFYINLKEGQQAQINQNIRILVPTKSYTNGMQLYDGQQDSTGNINWVNPSNLPQTQMSNKIALGENLYQNCASCHSIFENKTGPALYNIQNRRPKQWLYDFTRNSAKLISSNSSEVFNNNDSKDTTHHILKYDYYATCIYTLWNKTAMTGFPKLTDDELNAIYTYIKNESDKKPELEAKFKYTCCDSCETYQRAIENDRIQLSKVFEEQNKLFSLEQTIVLKKNKLLAQQSNPEIFENISAESNSTFQQTQAIPSSTVSNVSPELTTGTYYELDIKTFGWKNIDILFTTNDKIVNSTLWLKIPESKDFKLRVQLLIPSYKISVEGGRVENDLFSFKTSNGKINLPLGDSCFIIALAEKNDELFFGSSSFIASQNQSIEIEIHAKKPIEINLFLNNLNLDGLQANVKEKKDIEQLKKIDKEIQKIQNDIFNNNQTSDIILEKIQKLSFLRPKNCECDEKTYSEEFNIKRPINISGDYE